MPPILSDKSVPQESGSARLWTFLNSSFGLFLLGSVGLSFLTWGYTEFSLSIEQRKVTGESVMKLNTEMSYRIRLIDDYFNSECSEESILEKRGKETFVDIRNIYRADPKYRSIFPENKEKDLHIVLWELSALLDEKKQKAQKEALIDSFDKMLYFNAYLNRLNDQTTANGNFYDVPINFGTEVKELKDKFAAAKKAIADQFPDLVPSATTAQSP